MIFDLLRRKETRTIVTSEQLLERISSFSRVSSGVFVTPETALRHGYVFACIRVLAESIGQLPLHLFRETDQSKAKARSHPLFSILHDAPNEFHTAQEFWEMCVAHVALRGNFYAFIGRVGGKVTELLPLQPDAVTPKRIKKDKGWAVVYEVAYPGGEKAVLVREDVFHVRAMSLDGLTGVSPISEAGEQLGLSMATEMHAATFFRNGASPGGVLQTDQTELPDATYKRLKESWEERHGGAENAHRVAILEGGLKWASTGMSAEDAQLLESRKLSRTEICGLFRVPPTMVGDLERATFSNTEQQNRQFVDYSLMPYLTRIESRIRLQLLSPKDRETHFAKFNVGALLRGDTAARTAAYATGIQNGWMSPNEARELEDLNPRPGGDLYLVPGNLNVSGPDGVVPMQQPQPQPKPPEEP